MNKKEYYKHILPHFQQPGQTYFVTWILKDAIPPHALNRYTEKLAYLKAEIDRFNLGAEVSNLRLNRGWKPRHPDVTPELQKLITEYNFLRKKYIDAYDELLAVQEKRTIDLSKPEISIIIAEACMFWEAKKLENIAFCIMPNHVHWVFRLKEKDENGKWVYLQDIMHSVKRQTSREINKLTGRRGALWQKESFDTTIRDMEHEYNAVKYTLNNPVKAGFVTDWQVWQGSWCCEEYKGCGGF